MDAFKSLHSGARASGENARADDLMNVLVDGLSRYETRHGTIQIFYVTSYVYLDSG